MLFDYIGNLIYDLFKDDVNEMRICCKDLLEQQFGNTLQIIMIGKIISVKVECVNLKSH